jgi:ABC-type sulfate transport system substrate-binding protein
VLLQARAVIDGLPADVVALALPLDVQKIADAGLLRPDWRKMYPLQSVGECGGWLVRRSRDRVSVC